MRRPGQRLTKASRQEHHRSLRELPHPPALAAKKDPSRPKAVTYLSRLRSCRAMLLNLAASRSPVDPSLAAYRSNPLADRAVARRRTQAAASARLTQAAGAPSKALSAAPSSW